VDVTRVQPGVFGLESGGHIIFQTHESHIKTSEEFLFSLIYVSVAVLKMKV